MTLPRGLAATRPLRLVLLALSLAMSLPARAQQPDEMERRVAEGLRPLYADALAKSGSNLRPGSPAYAQALAASASAFLAARPDTCDPGAWLSLACGARSLITPSEAMAPSLMAGDAFLTLEPDEARPLRRGDVVAFRDPRRGDTGEPTIYVKRLIGMPGDRVHLTDGTVAIDGTPVERKATGHTVMHDESLGDLMRFTETLPGGRSYAILRPAKLPEDAADLKAQESMPEVTVPEGRYFVLGDNRLASDDSRPGTENSLGLPARADIVGWVKVVWVSHDPSRIGEQP